MPDKERITAIEADSAMRGRLLLLVGARRSGTNWVERILTSHPGVVAMPTETYLFSHGARPFADLIQHTSPGTRTISRTYMERDAFRFAMRQFLDTVFLDCKQRLGSDATYLLERTPWHAEHLDLIADLYPDARVINLIRDGRAVTRSLLTLPGGPRTIADAAIEWRSAIVGGRRGAELFGDRFLELRYETLLADPSQGIEALFRWLELPMADDVMAEVLFEAAAEFNVDPGAPGVGKDKWRTEFSRGDLAELHRIVGAELQLLGYADGARAAGQPGRALRDRAKVPAALKRLKHPMAFVERRFRKQAARDARVELLSNRALVERFSDLAFAGRRTDASTLCAPGCRFKLVDGNEVVEGRGKEVLDAIFDALERHAKAGMRPIESAAHPSPRLITTHLVYQLENDSRWTQTGVYELIGGVITNLTVYRFALAKPVG